jgi:hypothetical protein
MPRRAVGHGRAVTALTAARVAGRAVGAWGELGDFQINNAGFCVRMQRAPIGNYEIQREESR